MIVYEGYRNIFDSDADTLVCPVNCEGVMGRGLALPFKERCGGLFDAYRKACLSGELRPGVLWLWQPKEGPKVLCFPTKDRWSQPSKRLYIEGALKTLA